MALGTHPTFIKKYYHCPHFAEATAKCMQPMDRTITSCVPTETNLLNLTFRSLSLQQISNSFLQNVPTAISSTYGCKHYNEMLPQLISYQI